MRVVKGRHPQRECAWDAFLDTGLWRSLPAPSSEAPENSLHLRNLLLLRFDDFAAEFDDFGVLGSWGPGVRSRYDAQCYDSRPDPNSREP